ncbi:hypothetical protein AMECASPLE_030468 [Ameca splendens]|uniref:Uncharacterized protein n=1 Tax=Ameca splendens TaxID=208324 RepID=A0ABV0YI84_9TELE
MVILLPLIVNQANSGSLAAEECYSDVLQQAQAAVEAQRVRHGIPVGRGPQEPADCAPTYEELIHLEVERLLVIENALRVPDRLLELSDQPSSLSQWQNLSK